MLTNVDGSRYTAGACQLPDRRSPDSGEEFQIESPLDQPYAGQSDRQQRAAGEDATP